MSTLAPPVFIVCSTVLQVTSTTIRSRMGSEFSMIRPVTAGLPALERLGNQHGFIMGEKHSSAFSFGWICFIIAGIKGIYKSLDEFEFWSDPSTNCWVSCP